MSNNKLINKLVLNTNIIGDVLLTGIILCGNYKPTPEILLLTGTTLLANTYSIKKKVLKK